MNPATPIPARSATTRMAVDPAPSTTDSVQRPQVVNLRTNGLVNPIGIDQAPRLSWEVQGCAGQAAYEIRAASDLASLERDQQATRTGRIDSSRTSNVELSQIPPASRSTVAWQVRIWDTDGHRSDWSDPATWEMGLLTRTDWHARWIENPSYEYTQADGTETPLPVFGRSFTVPGSLAKARLYITGLGMYRATINGRPIGAAVLEPGQTTYAAEVNYRTHDLTGQVIQGINIIGVETGSGPYQRVQTPGRYFFGSALEQHTVFGRPKIIAQLELTFDDGQVEVIATDNSWRTALGPTTFSSWWSGEEYDARRAATTPDAPENLDATDWQNAVIAALSTSTVPSDTTPLIPDPRPPVILAETIQPTDIYRIGDGSYVADFGANRAGWPQLRLTDTTGAAGATITLTPSECVHPDGTLDTTSTGADETRGTIAYRYTLAGNGSETWHPHFTYSGFRYLQVDGLTEPPTGTTVSMLVLHAANPPASTFTSSNDTLNAIRAMTLRSIQSNMMSVLTDCPNREKGPYVGDNLHNLDALLTDYDMSAYQPQLVRNMATAQRGSADESPGLIANIAPEFHRVQPMKIPFPQGTIQFLDEINWGAAIIRIPWKLYQTYGDIRTMALYYDNMARWLDYEAANRIDNDGDIPGLGDWSANDNTTPLQLPIYAGYYTAAVHMSKIAGVLGRTEDKTAYSELAVELAATFTSRFRHTDETGVYYGSDSETSNAMALDAGLVPDADRAAVLNRLVASVRRADNRITTGSVGLGPLFRALEAGDRNDVIYDMVSNPDSPGYGYLVASGRTALPESLDGSDSQNHHFLGQVDAWLISGLAGIKQSTGSIGFASVDIAPAIVGDLTKVSGTYHTPYGTVESTWKKHPGGRLTLRVRIPSGVTGTIRVPAAGQTVTTTSTNSSEHNALRRSTSDGSEFVVGAGRYTFTTG